MKGNGRERGRGQRGPVLMEDDYVEETKFPKAMLNETLNDESNQKELEKKRLIILQ